MPPTDGRPLCTFDIDGVLAALPFHINPAWRRDLTLTPADPARVRHAQGLTLWDRLARETYYRVRFLGRSPRPGAREAVLAARARYRVCALTGRNWRGRAATERWLRRHDLLSLFDDLIFNDTTLGSSRFKRHAADRLGVVRHVEDDAATAALLARGGVRVDLLDWPRNRGLALPPGVTRRTDLRALAAAFQSPDPGA